MDLRWLDLEALAGAVKRPSCRKALGFIALGMSAFGWPYFPDGYARIAFASMFSLGVTATGAWVGSRVDAFVNRRRRRRRRRRKRLGNS